MGTKRHMVDIVRKTVLDLEPSGPVVDLFAGMGTVAASLAEYTPIVANDALGFVACLSRSRFLGATRSTTSATAAARIRDDYDCHSQRLGHAGDERLVAEQAALASSDTALADYMRRAAHVAGSSAARREARLARTASGADFYRLTGLYFSSGYFTFQQANGLDALRAAIDDDTVIAERDWLLSAWLGTASAVMNAPGHTAQFLFPRSQAAAERVRRAAKLDVWEVFTKALAENVQVGSAAWRASNRVSSSDALTLLTSNDLADASVLYADPPYTRDQYSRYYHVYETLYRYDFPDARGQGRNRSDGFITDFSQKSGVDSAFRALFRGARRLQVPLVVSYPENGLLTTTGSSLLDVAQDFFKKIEIHTVSASHSTLGASTGSQKKAATEQLFVLAN
jgi:adenine-specific DNA-methyltransferase